MATDKFVTKENLQGVISAIEEKNNSFSYNETQIGTWNGKPLYRKVFLADYTGSATVLIVAENVKEVVHFERLITRTVSGAISTQNTYASTFTAPGATNGDWVFDWVSLNVDDQGGTPHPTYLHKLFTNRNRGQRFLTGKDLVIVEYTKTTD